MFGTSSSSWTANVFVFVVYLCTVPGAIGSDGITVLCHGLRFFGWAVHEGEKVMEVDDGDDGKTKCFLYILNG